MFRSNLTFKLFYISVFVSIRIIKVKKNVFQIFYNLVDLVISVTVSKMYFGLFVLLTFYVKWDFVHNCSC